MTAKNKIRLVAGCVIIALSICGCVDANRLRTESFEIQKEAEEHVVTVIPVKQLPINKPTQRPYPDFDLNNLSIIGQEGQINDSSRVESVGESAEDNGGSEGSELFIDETNDTGSGSESGYDPDSGYIVEVEGSADEADLLGGYTESVPELVESESNYGAETESSGDEGYSFETDTQDSGEPEGLTYLGDWTITAYCPCNFCCGAYSSGYTASGTLATSGRTIACNALPMGSQVMIAGTVYTVEDTGWSPYGDTWIDIFFDTHEEAVAFGMKTMSVYLVE